MLLLHPAWCWWITLHVPGPVPSLASIRLNKPFLPEKLLSVKGVFFLFFFFKILLYLRGKGREKERERTINVWLPLSPPLLGTWPTTQACALTGKPNCDPFCLQVCAQSTEPHQPGLAVQVFVTVLIVKHFA